MTNWKAIGVIFSAIFGVSALIWGVDAQVSRSINSELKMVDLRLIEDRKDIEENEAVGKEITTIKQDVALIKQDIGYIKDQIQHISEGK